MRAADASGYMATEITLNMAKALRKLHLSRRRKQISKYVKKEVARRLKMEVENVKLSNTLNRQLLVKYVKNPRALKLSIENKEGKSIVTLPLQAEAKTAQAQQPQQKPSTAKQSQKTTTPAH